MLNRVETRRAILSLSPREREVLMLVAEGMPLKAVAAKLTISERAVRQHLANACKRLDCKSTPNAVAKALRLGLI